MIHVKPETEISNPISVRADDIIMAPHTTSIVNTRASWKIRLHHFALPKEILSVYTYTTGRYRVAPPELLNFCFVYRK